MSANAQSHRVTPGYGYTVSTCTVTEATGQQPL